MKRLLLLAALAAMTVVAQELPESIPVEGHGESAHQETEGNTIWKWADFALLAGLIGWGISKGAGAFFHGRNEAIQKALRDAHQAREEAEARAAEIERRMVNLQSEIQELRTNSQREMAAESARLQAETTRMAARVEESAAQEIASATKQATQELRAFSGELALELAQEKVRARMTPDKQGALVDSFVSMLGRPDGPAH